MKQPIGIHEREEPPSEGTGPARLSQRTGAPPPWESRVPGRNPVALAKNWGERLLRWRYVRFCSVGTSGLLLEMGLLYLLLPAHPTPLWLNAKLGWRVVVFR